MTGGGGEFETLADFENVTCKDDSDPGPLDQFLCCRHLQPVLLRHSSGAGDGAGWWGAAGFVHITLSVSCPSAAVWCLLKALCHTSHVPPEGSSLTLSLETSIPRRTCQRSTSLPTTTSSTITTEKVASCQAGGDG